MHGFSGGSITQLITEIYGPAEGDHKVRRCTGTLELAFHRLVRHGPLTVDSRQETHPPAPLSPVLVCQNIK